MLEILRELLARLEPASGLSQILLLQELDVNELVFVAEHGVDAVEADHGGAAHRFSLKVLKAAHLHAELLQLYKKESVSFFHSVLCFLFYLVYSFDKT